MNRESKKYLFDVLAACDEIASFVRGESHESYVSNALLRRAVERDVEIIGEALAQLRSADTETAASVPDSSRIIGMRHRLIHGYAEVDDDIVWDAANHDIPELADIVRTLLDQ